MASLYTIYTITPINVDYDEGNSVYVGVTKNSLNERYKQHMYMSKRISNKFYDCVAETGGWDAWRISEYQTVECTRGQALMFETASIQYYKSENYDLLNMLKVDNEQVELIDGMTRADYHRRYRHANKSKISEHQRRYQQANQEKIAEYKRKYYQANKEKILARQPNKNRSL